MINKLKRKLNTDPHLKELLSGSAITFVLKMGGMALSFLVIYIISKKIGADGVGFYTYFNQVLIVLSMILGIGLNISVLRFVGQFNNEVDSPKLHLLYRYILKTIPLFSTIFGIILFFSSEFICELFGKNENYVNALKLVSVTLPFFTISQINVEFIRGLKKIQISELVRSVTLPLIIVVFLFIKWNDSLKIEDVILAFTAATISNFLFSSTTIWFQLNKIRKETISIFSKRELFKTSFPMMLTGVSHTLIVAMPIFVLDFFTNQKDVGVFSVAFKIAQIISLVLVIINTMAAPKFSELFWSNKINELQKLVSQSVKIMFWAALLLSIFVIIGADWILNIFGSEFDKGWWALIILIFGQIVNAASGSVGTLLNMSGNEKIFRNIILTSAVFISLLSIVLIPAYGILGAAIAYSINEIFWNFTAIYFVKKKMKIIAFYLPVKFNNANRF